MSWKAFKGFCEQVWDGFYSNSEQLDILGYWGRIKFLRLPFLSFSYTISSHFIFGFKKIVCICIQVPQNLFSGNLVHVASGRCIDNQFTDDDFS